MVYSTYFWWFGEWFIIVLTTLYPYLPRLPAQPMGQSHGLPGSRADPGEAGKPWTCSLGCFHSHGGTPQNGWFRREDPKKKTEGFGGTPILGNHGMKTWESYGTSMGFRREKSWEIHVVSSPGETHNGISKRDIPRGVVTGIWHGYLMLSLFKHEILEVS